MSLLSRGYYLMFALCVIKCVCVFFCWLLASVFMFFVCVCVPLFCVLLLMLFVDFRFCA